jgi:IS30 family transposase
MLAMKCSYSSIAEAHVRSISTIGREVYRNYDRGEYLAVEAHQQASKRQAYSHAPKSKIASNEQLVSLINTKLRLRWSPVQISSWLLTTLCEVKRLGE